MTSPSDTPSSDDVFSYPGVTAEDLQPLPPVDEVEALLERADAVVEEVEDEAVEEPKEPWELWCEAETLWKRTVRAATVEADWETREGKVPFDVVQYEGDWLGIRIPSQAALTAFTLGTGEGSPDDTRQVMTTKFIQKHTSPRSFIHVFTRMMDPDDDYTDDKLGSLMGLLATRAGQKIAAEAKAEAEAAKAKKLAAKR